jgi:heat shock protein HslJ
MNTSMGVRAAGVVLCLGTLIGCSQEPDAPPPVPEPEPAAAGASAGAEASTVDTPPPELVVGESWTLSAASIEALQAKAAEAGIFVEVQEARLVGYAGCNRFSAPMRREGLDGLSVEPPVASKRGCADEAMNAAERAFLDALPQLRRFEIADGRLLLLGADGLSLEFVPGRPGAAQEMDQ